MKSGAKVLAEPQPQGLRSCIDPNLSKSSNLQPMIDIMEFRRDQIVLLVRFLRLADGIGLGSNLAAQAERELNRDVSGIHLSRTGHFAAPGGAAQAVTAKTDGLARCNELPF